MNDKRKRGDGIRIYRARACTRGKRDTMRDTMRDIAKEKDKGGERER